ncbi:hypothetical protein [Streptomyces sp. NPDC002671]
MANGTDSLAVLLSGFSLFMEDALNVETGPVRYLRIGPLHAGKQFIQLRTGSWLIVHAAVEDIRK